MKNTETCTEHNEFLNCKIHTARDPATSFAVAIVQLYTAHIDTGMNLMPNLPDIFKKYIVQLYLLIL